MFYVYAHIRKDTNKIFYIGKGSSNRLYRKDNRNKYWKHITNKHGFDAIILESNLTESEAFDLEKFYIKQYKDKGLILVNQTDGGDGNNPSGGFSFKNKKHSLETKMLLSSQKIGKPKTKEHNLKNALAHKQKICINDIVYESWQDASLKTGIPMGSFSYILKSNKPMIGKYSWVYNCFLVM